MARSLREHGLTILLIAVLSASALSSCSSSNGASPLGPTTLGSASTAAAPTRLSVAGGQGSDHNTQLNFSVDLTIPPYPVCSLTPPSAGVIKGTGLITITIRSVTDGSGGTHVGIGIHGHGTATDETGTRWVWSDSDLNNEVVGIPTGQTNDHRFVNTIRENFKVVAPGGQQILVKGTFHITQVDGSTVVEVDNGNHAADEVCESGFVLTPLP